MYGGGSRLLGGMRAMLGIGEKAGALFDDTSALMGNTFMDVGASGAQILANPQAYLQAVASGVMDNDHRLSQEWLALRDERRGKLPEWEYSDQGRDMASGAAQALGNSDLAAAYNTWAARNPNASETIETYATSPTMGAVMAGVESIAAPASQLGKRGAAYIAADVTRRSAAPTLGEALFETLAPKGLPAGGQTGIFAGRQSLTNLAESGKKVRTSHGELDAKDLYANMAEAERMASEGVSPDVIWANTGWFQGADDMWRYEISDDKAGWDESKLRSNYFASDYEKFGQMGDALDHPDLEAAFPGMADISLDKTGATRGGSYQQPDMNKDETINIGFGNKDPRSTALHEVQHGIQYREGTNRGANPGSLQRPDEFPDFDVIDFTRVAPIMERYDISGDTMGENSYEFMRRVLGEALQKDAPETDIAPIRDELFKLADAKKEGVTEHNAHVRYNRSAGEVEARNVQARRDMTPQERAEIPPIETESVPRGDQWVDLKGGGTPQSIVYRGVKPGGTNQYESANWPGTVFVARDKGIAEQWGTVSQHDIDMGKENILTLFDGDEPSQAAIEFFGKRVSSDWSPDDFKEYLADRFMFPDDPDELADLAAAGYTGMQLDETGDMFLLGSLKDRAKPPSVPDPATLGTALEQALTPHTTQGPIRDPRRLWPNDPVTHGERGRPQGAIGGPPTRQPQLPANRDQRWASQQATAQRIRGQRNKKTGVYLGAPKHIDTPAKKNGLVTAYANRVDRAIANGVAPGYFYDDGARAIGEIAEPGQALKTGQGTGVTSTMVGPEENMNYLVKGREQQTMVGSAAVSTTLFPNASQSEFINTMNPARETPWLGHKRERYANLLVPEGDLPPDMPEGSMLAPNDRWEGRGAGFAGPPSGELQVSWNDEIRELAQARVNKRRAARGEAPLTVKQVQELHWAQIRADADGRTPKIRPSDTISGSIDRLEYQHSWETNPGKTSNHNPEVGGTIPAADYHADLKPLLIGEDGKDKLIRGMSGGGAFQRQAIDGPGEYKGQYSPSTQSRSLVSHTKSGGLDKVSEARVGATEAVRSFILAQDADAGSLFAPLTTPKGKFNALAFNPGKPISEAQLKAINARVRANFGVKAADDIVVVPTAGGVRIFHPSPDRKFPKRLAAMNDEIKKITGVDGVKGSTQSHYNELGWEKGTATADMLKILDNPDAPLLLKHANSRQVRQLMGSFADKYEALQKAGLSPNQKLIDVLKAWRDRGLPAVREMVKAGTAPAAALAILSQEE